MFVRQLTLEVDYNGPTKFRAYRISRGDCHAIG